MNTAIENVKSLLNTLPEDSTLEDVQYHLYVIEKIQKGISRAKFEVTLSQGKVEQEFHRWTSQQNKQ